ncbi:hypothetical protein BC826DRAFT_1073795 [Russula brevipes]|nr:hypothetical protein BC826DRAFT_1073795 [Russula brevipes]
MYWRLISRTRSGCLNAAMMLLAPFTRGARKPPSSMTMGNAAGQTSSVFLTVADSGDVLMQTQHFAIVCKRAPAHAIDHDVCLHRLCRYRIFLGGHHRGFSHVL